MQITAANTALNPDEPQDNINIQSNANNNVQTEVHIVCLPYTNKSSYQ